MRANIIYISLMYILEYIIEYIRAHIRIHKHDIILLL